MSIFAHEITSTADCAVILARCILKLNAAPDARCKVRFADETKCADFAAGRRLHDDTIVDFEFARFWKELRIDV